MKDNRHISEKEYFLCKDSKCDVVYYSGNVVIEKDKIKVPVAFKEDANPKYICYCSEITEEKVIRVVREHGARTIVEVNKIAGTMGKCNCEIENPSGKCCGSEILKIIEKED
ncbi:hypothetical protein CCE28_20465 [Anaeromicrobium sediminis]|uniref:CopZ zinc binding domain-containing protein n=1 Tax=Anaeromicrobium sediminis TaxID=1478221 RepID=A0A267MCY4_9FIRM|nr:hypothetical protein CCE28_20465 [Anaeromicrobium sediminis]